MAKLVVDFEWPVAKSYSYEAPEKLRAPATIAQSGESFGFLVATGATTMRRPLDGRGGFLKVLLSGQPLREIALNAAATYGMLTCPSSGELQREPLYLWKELIDDLRNLQKIETVGLARGGSIGARLDVLLLPAAGRSKPHFSFQPVNLRDAIKIFWATAIVSGGTLRPCKQCGEFFEAGGQSERRADAQFCSPSCRHRFSNNLKRTQRPHYSA